MHTAATPRRPTRDSIASAGFTLVELLIVLAVAGILAGVAVPSLRGSLNTVRAASLAHTFVASLNHARSEAIKRNKRAVLCKSAAGLACVSSGGWEQGWILFQDSNNNARLDAGEPVVLQHGGARTGLRLTGNQPVANYVSYSPSGSAKMVSGAFQAGTFTLCPSSASGAPVQKIVLSGTGRPRMDKGVASDCP